MGSPINDINLTEDDVVSAYEIRLTPSYIVLFYLVGLSCVTIYDCSSSLHDEAQS